MKTLPRNSVLAGTAEEILPTLLPESVDAIVTSPPYYRQRDYGLGSGELGQEPNVGLYVERLRLLVGLMRPVLKSHGSLWLNVGDSYSRHVSWGTPPKSLLGVPQRLAVGLLEDGLTLRNVVIWSKANGLPQSARDRLTPRHEYVFHFVQQPAYYYDLDAIREAHRTAPRQPRPAASHRRYQGGNAGLARLEAGGRVGHARGANPGDVWTHAAANFRGAHFATFNPELVERPIAATVPERICTQCDAAWRRDTRVVRVETAKGPRSLREVGELQRCDCFAPSRAGVVLDPFCGAGTVGLVAERLGRDWLGIEPNDAYRALAEERLGGTRSGRLTGGRKGSPFCPPSQPPTPQRRTS